MNANAKVGNITQEFGAYQDIFAFFRLFKTGAGVVVVGDCQGVATVTGSIDRSRAMSQAFVKCGRAAHPLRRCFYHGSGGRSG